MNVEKMVGAIQKTLDDAAEKAAFFGCHLNQVSQINRVICVNYGMPEWLRGKPKFNDLPRCLNPNITPYYVPPGLVTDTQIAERVIWIVENLQHGWSLGVYGYGFMDESEAAHFKMRWSLG